MCSANTPIEVPATRSTERILAIGMPEALNDRSRSIRLAALDAALLAEFCPERVVFALFAPEHDALVVIERLEDLGYTGLMTVIAPFLPRPKLVEAELRAQGPGKRLNLLVVKPDQA